MNFEITLRPVGPQDEEFLYRVYASTREEELAPVLWDVLQKEAFLRMQFSLQHKYYTEVFASASFMIIELGGRSIGRLYRERKEDELNLIDLALLPEYRGRGIGTFLLKSMQAEAGDNNVPMRVYVERFNKAQSLYKRLGFTTIGDTDVYLLMEWKPAG